ncbi:Hypothetical predicted protein [Mytilus galloprovincialis]|uniref:CARD domain-containing protein n=1 Tax=Mytilus galloprovincialis TaxID=29158 RepID=A0A8B6G2R9_MYTGA|nr:Hypothetical predicted protein [Mytilus galloprovincialis]
MDRRDQKKLIRNLGRLVAETPTDPVVQYLVDKNILTSELAEDILYQNTSRNKIGQLVFTLARRGPKAFGGFVEALRFNDCEELAEALKCN